MSSKPIIRLTPSEMQQAEELALEIHRQNRSKGIKDTMAQRNKRKDWYNEVNGYLAEFAFCKHYGLQPDTSVSARTSAADVYLDGYGIDIKWSNGTNLLAHNMSDDVDIYFLVKGSGNVFWLMGWAKAIDLIRPENWGDHFNQGPGRECYRLPLSELREPWETGIQK